MNKINFIRIFFILLLISFLFSSCTQYSITYKSDEIIYYDEYEAVTTPAANASWTIMLYSDADNNLEGVLLSDIQEIKNGIVDSAELNVIVLIDRTEYGVYDKSVLNIDFNDTRLYRIRHNRAIRLGGGTIFPEISQYSSFEADMGNPEILKNFIDYCKFYFPADHYALILADHGSGLSIQPKSTPAGSSLSFINYYVCSDYTNLYNALNIGEISNILTGGQSVDLLGFDACYMGSIETAYQYRHDGTGTRFGAYIMVASAPTERGDGWQYDAIFSHINADVSSDGYFSPQSLTASQLGKIIVDEQEKSTVTDYRQSLFCLDLTQAETVKTAFDQLSCSLSDKKNQMETVRDQIKNTINGMYYSVNNSDAELFNYPYFDLYDICSRINTDSNFNSTVHDQSFAVMNALDNLIIDSFGHNFTDFINGKNGISIFFPKNFLPWWYNAIDISVQLGSSAPCGYLDWCKDGAAENNSTVENWFELLDSWYDNTTDGGFNHYAW